MRESHDPLTLRYPFCLMSSAKDYLLHIETESNGKAATFTVCRRPLVFFKYLRTPLVVLLFAWSVSSILEIRNDIAQSGTDTAVFVKNLIQELFLARQFLNDSWWHVLIALSSICAALALASLQQPSDSIMIMENMGIQLTNITWWSFTNGVSNGEFVPLSEIIDIVIHEGFHSYGQIIFYMCVLTRAGSSNSDSGSGNGVKVVFPNFLPRKDILLQVWKQSRSMLYGQNRKRYRRIQGESLLEVN